MSVVAIGLNHRTASLGLLERLTIDQQHLPKALADLTTRPHLSEAVVLSTCNRTEVYAVAERFHGGFQDVRDFLAQQGFLAPEDFADHLYVLHDDEAVGHLFEVAAGLDSAVLGESEILGQVGAAWDVARAEGAAGPTLNLLFRHALEAGKRVRTETGISRGITSVSHAAVALAADRLGSLVGRRVLVVGAGEVGQGMAAALAGAGVADVLVANRTVEVAVEVAERVGGRPLPLRDLTSHLVEVDVLLTSTSSESLLIEHRALAEAVERRDGRPLLVIDVAVPRDVDPAAATLPGVTLLDMEALSAFVERAADGRRREAANARTLLADAVARYTLQATAREVAPVVAALHDRAEALRLSEVERVAGRLAGLDDRERQTVEALTKAIVAKLLHEPTVRLKAAAGTAKGDRLVESTRDLFDL